MVSKSGCVGWLKKRTNLEKTLLSLSSLLLLILLLIILLGIAFHGKKREITSNEEVCWSNDCIRTAGDVISKMETTVDACTDPYDYACGKYGQHPGETISVPERSTESVYFSLKKILESKEKLNINGLNDVRSFYDSCVQFGSYRQVPQETAQALLKLVSANGLDAWPIIYPNYDDSNFSLEHNLARLILLDVPVVFRMEIIPDKNLAGSYLIKISPGGPRESGRSPDEIRSDVHLSYSVLTSLLLLGASSAKTDAPDVLSVDINFAKIEQNKNTICDDVTTFAPQEAISKMNQLIPEINWDIIMSEIQKATGLQRPFAVQLHCKQKIRKYVDELDKPVVRTVSNYLGWRFLSKYAEHIIPTFQKSQFGSGKTALRWRVCLELMEKFASPILAEVLAEKMINNEIQDEVRKISSATLIATQQLVSRARWLSDSQRSLIREKVARMRVRYPFQAKDNAQITPIHIPGVNVTNFTAVVVNHHKQWVIQKFRRLNPEMEPSEVTEYWMPLLAAREDSSSSDVTAFVYFDKIRNPFIRIHGPKWMNYGAFGVSVAREISKVLMLMNAGANHEENIALWNVWSRSRNSSMCLVKPQASRLGITDKALPSDVTERLMKDVFLDHSAIEIAYEAALSLASTSKSRSLPGLDLSNGEMFFISYAQTICEADTPLQMSKHIPAKDRLNTVVMNFGAFNKAFDCAPSSQCQIWTA